MALKEKQSQTEQKKALLNAQIENFKTLIKACEEIRDGKSETFVCNKYNISRNQFRHIIFNPKLGFEYEPIDPPITDKEDPDYQNYWRKQWNDYCWQEKLFCAVFAEYNINNVPADIDESVEYVLNNLTEREKEVLIYRFRDCLTLQEVANIYDRTRDRIRQIEAKALRKLRHPSRANILKYGIEIAEKTVAKNKELEANRQEYCDRVNKEIQNARKAIVGKQLSRLIEVRDSVNSLIQKLSGDNPDDDLSSIIRDGFKSISINDLSLSTRTYNCIRRGGFEYIEDFEGKTVSDMLRIRNMGMHSVKELSDVLAKYGIKFIDDRNE